MQGHCLAVLDTGITASLSEHDRYSHPIYVFRFAFNKLFYSDRLNRVEHCSRFQSVQIFITNLDGI
jgi:hypothetical protein